MRTSLTFALAVVTSLAGFLAHADPTVAALVQKLHRGETPEARILAAQRLASIAQPSAGKALCQALLEEADERVRAAVARALGEQPVAGALECLEKAGTQPLGVAAEMTSAKAVAQARAQAKPVRYVSLPPVEDRAGSLDAQVVSAAELALREKLASVGSVFARPGESVAEARKVMKGQKLEGYQLKVQLTLIEGGGLVMDLACFTYPDRKLLGALKVEARGARPTTLVDALAPQAVDEAAITCKWKH